MGQPESGELLRRYEGGEHEGVWAELMALGPRVRDAAHFADAWAVARETMRRARHNVELIIRRLDSLDYRFWNGKQGKAKGPPSRVTFGSKTIEGSPPEALLAAMFAEAKKLPPAQVTPVMVDQLRNIHQLAMFPWQDRALLLKGQRFARDAEVWALFDQAKKVPAGQLAAAMIERLHDLHLSALDQAMAYWRDRGEDPPALREKKAAEARQQQEAHSADHRQDRKVFSPPVKKDVALIRKLEKEDGFLPLSLRAWIEEVGDINLAGAHPGLCFWEEGNFPGVYADPLMVAPHLFLYELADWHGSRAAEGALDALVGWNAKAKARLVVADEQLDYGYTIKLPNLAADAPLDGALGNATFVGYLRRAFRWGGFPGWEQQERRPERELEALRDGLLPL